MMKELKNRWQLQGAGGIVWELEKDGTDGTEGALPHEDHLEMSGEYVSQHVVYRVDEQRRVTVEQTLVWPWLRVIPNDTHGSFKTRQRGGQTDPAFTVNQEETVMTGRRIVFDGILHIHERGGNGDCLETVRSYYPSPAGKGAFMKIRLRNISAESLDCAVKIDCSQGTGRGTEGIYVHGSKLQGEGEFHLGAQEQAELYVLYTARRLYEEDFPPTGDEEDFPPAGEEAAGRDTYLAEPDGRTEAEKRGLFLAETGCCAELITPDEMLNQAFAFAKIRSTESIFRTRTGLLHSPGGLHYYAGIWANDQAEYANPFFAFTGMEKPVASSLLCYRLFRRFMGPGMEAIPSSIVAEGMDIWEGKGDRGDAAMYAYGASRFLLTLGCRQTAAELFDGVAWCLQYCEGQKTAEGIIRSDSDELEGRFPAGEANLATSCLTYEALRTGAILARELNKQELADCYESRRLELGAAIEAYFGREIAGFATYRYSNADDSLRSWICIPLTMGILNRKSETIAALTSGRLWTEDGLLTMEGDNTFWDRSTLYALRGMFAAGYGDRAGEYLREYSRRRVLGEHVPYPVEAYPEGGQRQLSAESALYARIYIEGIFGISPAGLRRFICHPCLPGNWPSVTLKNIQYGGTVFDLYIGQDSVHDQYEIVMTVVTGQKKSEQKKWSFSCPRGGEAVIDVKPGAKI